MTTSKNLLFFGNERLSTGFNPGGAPTLERLIAAGYTISAVIANHEEGTSRKKRELEVATVAKAHNIPVLLPNKPKDIIEQLQAYGAEAAILVSYGRIIPQSVIDIFPKGILNIHPSLLPQYRGSTPIEQAMLDGVKETGVSIMQLVKAMDAGPTFAQATIPVPQGISKQELTMNLLQKGGDLLLKHLPAILDGSLQPTQQHESAATFTSQITKDSAWLKPNTKTAAQLEREVRAYFGWPKSKTTLFGHDIIVLEAVAAETPKNGTLVVPCAQDSYLEITKLIAPSGRSMQGSDFLRGYGPKA